MHPFFTHDAAGRKLAAPVPRVRHHTGNGDVSPGQLDTPAAPGQDSPTEAVVVPRSPPEG